jgi:hypothetical protein
MPQNYTQISFPRRVNAPPAYIIDHPRAHTILTRRGTSSDAVDARHSQLGTMYVPHVVIMKKPVEPDGQEGDVLGIR